MNGNFDHTGIMGRHADGRSRSCSRVVLFFAGLMILFAFAAEATIPTQEREALIAFYNSTMGPNWYSSYDWLGPVGTECWWSGVWCDVSQTTVVEIYMPENNVAGTIPPEIGDLTGLEFIYLPGNHGLGGPIPPEIGNLTNLEVVVITQNGIEGTLPPEITGLVSLRHLVLTNSQLSGPLPAEIGSLQALEYLDLSGNPINAGLPQEMGDLAALKELHLSYCDLTGPVPSWLENLTSLEVLNLTRNRFSGAIPTTLGDMPALSELYLSYNDLTGSFPSFLLEIDTLSTLSIYRNHFSGTLPPSLGSQPNLESIELSLNKFEGEIPPALGTHCDDGGSVYLGYNALFTDDPDLAAKLDECRGYWQPQGDPPDQIEVLGLTATSATFGWAPIWWQIGGVYEVLISTEPGGPYDRIASTTILDDKGLDRAVIGPLQPSTTYHAVVRSVSYPMPSGPYPQLNQNTVISRPSSELIFTTPPAETIHVATSGNDQNDCLSPASPCRTIQAAVDRTVSGGIVQVGPGFFEENVSIDRSLVIRGSSGSPTILDGLESGSTVFVASDTIVTLQNLHIKNGHAPYGGGVFNNGAVLFVLNSEVAHNSATFDGGGLFNEGGLLIIEDSTVAENTAGSDAAVATDTDPEGSPTTGFRNSTLSGNTSTDTVSRVLGPAHLMNCTVADNRAGFVGFVLESEGTRIQHTIIAGNHSRTCDKQTYCSRGHNLADDDSCFPADDYLHDLIVADAGLGPLDDHGGPTRTHDLLPGSPAIDAGDNDGAPIVDQRGVSRPIDGNGDGLSVVDVGAFESPGDAVVIFHDGFEIGDTSRWSTSLS